MRQLRREGVALAYEEAGRGAPPILLVHDLGSDHACFGAQFEHFRRGHRVVAVDLRGHGQSGRPRHVYTIALLADDLAWLCYELGLYRPVVLGRGLGAIVALELAARYQDLPAAIVAIAPARSPSVAPLALREDLAAPLLESLFSWDRAAAIAGCVVPVLQVALADLGEIDLHHAAWLADDARQGRQGQQPVERNLPVDTFISGRASRGTAGQRRET